jgi:hypothetical protein
MRRLFCLLLIGALLLQGCALLSPASTAGLGEGRTYYSSFYRTRASKVFISSSADTLVAAPLGVPAGQEASPVALYPESTPVPPAGHVYYRPSLDIDVLTIPFKYRSATAGFPRQLNTNFNAALYLGYRTDAYHIAYPRNPLGIYHRRITHVGFSLGVFGGIGATAMNPWVTNDHITSEYDGFILSHGLAAIVAVNNLSAGIALGHDYLTDEHRHYWIYQGKSWIGFVVGLNLN